MPGSANFAVADPDEFVACITDATVSLTIAGPGCFQASVNHVRLRGLHVLSCTERVARIAHVSLNSRMACILFLTREGAPAVFDGTMVQEGDFMILRAGEAFHTRTVAAAHWGAFFFDPKLLSGCAELFDGKGLTSGTSGWLARPPRPEQRRLLRLHGRACEQALACPRNLQARGPASELRRVMIEAVLGCLMCEQRQERSETSVRRAAVLNRFEAAVQAALAESPSLRSMIEQVGVPVRTLRAYCQQCLGVGPLRYLRLHQLNQARRLLRQPGPPRVLIRDLARRFGFEQAGRFSIEYEKLLGELPNSTARKAIIDDED